MLKPALITVAVIAVVAVAAPSLAMAKGKKADAAAGPATAGPIPYSQLAEEDAKLNGPAPKHHAAKKKATKDAAPASADAGKPAQ